MGAFEIIPTAIAGPRVLVPERHGDARGWLAETFSEPALAQAGLPGRFVQENQSYSREAGTLRGLHYQVAPHVQAKLVRVIRGAILDVAVDLRRGSPGFGRHVTAELSAENGRQLFIPGGFAHGFCTLEPETEVLYKLSDVYAPACERGVRFDDPALAIPWPRQWEWTISEKDRHWPRFEAIRDFPSRGSQPKNS